MMVGEGIIALLQVPRQKKYPNICSEEEQHRACERPVPGKNPCFRPRHCSLNQNKS